MNYNYDVTEIGVKGDIIRQFPSRLLQETKDVVCDDCNHTWMSDVTSHTKLTIEGFVRHQRPACLLPLGIVTLATFATMKGMVLDVSTERVRKPTFSRRACLRFRESLVSDDSTDVAFPDGLQIWAAGYHRARHVEARFGINELVLKSGRYAGFNIVVITYVVNAFVIQIACPRWTRLTRKPSDLPFIKQSGFWDHFSVPAWPAVDTVEWPPPYMLERDGRSLEDFEHRFGAEPMQTRL